MSDIMKELQLFNEDINDFLGAFNNKPIDPDKDNFAAKGFRKVGGFAKNADKVMSDNRVEIKSIVAKAKKSVLQFPIYTTVSIRANEAQIISKLFERVYASLVQSVISQTPILDESEANNLVFLKSVHTNIEESTNLYVKDIYVNEYYTPIDDIDEMICESIYNEVKLSDNVSVIFNIAPTDKLISEECARLNSTPLDGLTYLQEARAYNNYPNKEDKQYQIKKHITYETIMKQYTDANGKRAERPATENEMNKILDKMIKEDRSNRFTKKDGSKYKPDEVMKIIKNKPDGNEFSIRYSNGKFRMAVIDGSELQSGKVRETDVEIGAPVLLRDVEIKKINGMLPYSLQVHFRIHKNNGPDSLVTYVLGIKSVLHPIKAADLADDLQEIVTGDMKSLRKIRYKTGEIGFMDYMFNLKSIKKDALNRVDNGKKWINTLRRLGEFSKTNGSLLQKPLRLLSAISDQSTPIPNGTLILATSDVIMLKNETGIDLDKVSNVKKLAKSLFLIGFVIVDVSAGTMKVLFPDSDVDWDVQSLASVDAELAKTDNSKLMNELGKMVNR